MDISAITIIIKYGDFTEEHNLHSNYTGRFTYGKETKGLYIDTWNEFYFALARILKEASKVEREVISRLLHRGIHSDSLGHGIIIF